MLTYYDRSAGRDRYKRRYIWAFWAFWGGLLLGVAAARLI